MRSCWKPWTRFIVVVMVGALLGASLSGCAKKGAEPGGRTMVGPGMAMEGATARPLPPGGPAAKQAAAPPASASAAAGALPGGPGVPPPPGASLDKDAYYASTYMGGAGDRDRIEKLINEGVVVDGKTIKLAAFTRRYSQGFPIPTREAVAVCADLEQGKLPTQGGEVHLQVGLQAIQREAPRRPPINLCLVIDHSGSMADEQKLEYAKKAALDVISGLNATDTLAIVAYDQRVDVLLPSARLGDKSRAKAKITNLTVGGSTDIYAGLQAGYAQVKRSFTSQGINQVILLSDGQVTAGISDLNQFSRLVGEMADGDIQTTTVGMGMEFDETLMATVAQAGRGSFHFIKDASQTQRIFQQELGRLTRVVAKALRIRIMLPDDVALVRVLGSSALSRQEAAAVKRTERIIDQQVYEELGIRKDRRQQDEPGVKMLLPHFYGGDSHVVMLKLRIPPGNRTREVAKVEVKYKDLVFKQNRVLNRSAVVAYTRDKAAAIASVNRAVKKNVLGFKTGEALLTAADYIKQGRAADAVKAIDEQMVVLGLAAREWKDKDLDRDGQLLDKYKYVLANAGSDIADSELGSYLTKSLTYSGYELTR